MAHFSFPAEDDGHGDVAWTEAQAAEIQEIIARYPQKKAAIMPNVITSIW